MNIDDDALMALADGEIDGDEAARLHAAIKADPALAARYSVYAHTADWVQKAALADPYAMVSPGLELRVREMATTAPSGSENVVPLHRPTSRWQPVAVAAALALAIGLSGGLLLAPGAPEAGVPLLSSAVQERLGTLPSGVEAELPDGRRFSVVASFTDSAGAFCREYETAAEGGSRYVGVACRDGAAWSLRLAVATASEGAGYAPAASLEALDAFYASTGTSEPLSVEAERAFLE